MLQFKRINLLKVMVIVNLVHDVMVHDDDVNNYFTAILVVKKIR